MQEEPSWVCSPIHAKDWRFEMDPTFALHRTIHRCTRSMVPRCRSREPGHAELAEPVGPEEVGHALHRNQEDRGLGPRWGYRRHDLLQDETGDEFLYAHHLDDRGRPRHPEVEDGPRPCIRRKARQLARSDRVGARRSAFRCAARRRESAIQRRGGGSRRWAHARVGERRGNHPRSRSSRHGRSNEERDQGEGDRGRDVLQPVVHPAGSPSPDLGPRSRVG